MLRPLPEIALRVLSSRLYRVIQIVKLLVVLTRIATERNELHHYFSHSRKQNDSPEIEGRNLSVQSNRTGDTDRIYL